VPEGAGSVTLIPPTVPGFREQASADNGTADVWVTNCVPVWHDGVPQLFGAPETNVTLHRGIRIVNTTFLQVWLRLHHEVSGGWDTLGGPRLSPLQSTKGQPAVSISAAAGVELINNTVTWASGTPAPVVNFLGAGGVVGSVLQGNRCGEANSTELGVCIAQGFGD